MSKWTQTVVDNLRWDAVEPVSFPRCSAERWRRGLFWLDLSGLGLYLLDHLEQRGAAPVLPGPMLAQLRRNRDDNRLRNEGMLLEIHRIGGALESAGLRFAVLKGLSLVPIACPDPALRHQVDLDLLVDPASHDAVGREMAALGYTLVNDTAITRTYTRRPGFVPRHADAYRAGDHHAVEVHSSPWEFEEDIRLDLPSDLLSRARRTSSLFPYPALAPEDQFLHLAAHIVQHLMLYWVRLSWIYEFARVIGDYAGDESLWKRVQERAGERPNVAAVVALAVALARKIFACPIESGMQAWCERQLSPAMAMWVDRYGRDCCVRQYPGSKVTMLLQAQLADPARWHEYEGERLFPLRRRLQARVPAGARQAVSGPRRRVRFTTGRLLFHAREGIRYYYERWRWQRALREVEAAGAR